MMGLKFRLAASDDWEQFNRLYKLCYPLIDTTEEQRHNYFSANPRCSLDDIIMVLDGKEIVASMIAYPFTMFQEGIESFAIGIGNVMVSPERRKEGLAGEMMQYGLEKWESEDVPASMLYPFQHCFYRYMGWGYAGEIRQYNIFTEQLADFSEALEADDLRVEIVTEQNFDDLFNFYDAMARQGNCMLKRNELFWSQYMLAPPRYGVLAYDGAEVVGYLIYTPEEVNPSDPFVQQMVVKEWFAPSLDARDALLGFIARQSDQIESVQLPLQPNEPLHLWLDDPRNRERKMIHRLYAKTAEVGLGWMYRLVNLKAAFESGRRFNGVKGDLTVEMEDEQLGDRKLNVVFSGSGAKADGKGGKSKRLLSGEVDMLSQLFCGYMSAQQAYDFGLLEFEGSDTVDFCQQAFALPPPACFDLF
ncbi:GNAT family N-acetyltransferase [bacterium]|nr:GNAT family N-acetyltransferase [bacterium]MBU1652296.1 GNAT family N-acetyltransferase [bacterium]MBU1881298.1 GNAT family N-acetyltransferase [bacterium]